MNRRVTSPLVAAFLGIGTLLPAAIVAPVVAASASLVQQPVTSGLGVGVPGTLLAWESALDRFGTRSLSSLLKPAIDIADKGFIVNPIFAQQIAQNQSRFQDFSSTRALYLTGTGQAPAVGSLFRNPDLAKTYR